MLPERRLGEGACHLLATDGTLRTAPQADRTGTALSLAALPHTVAGLTPAEGPVAPSPPRQRLLLSTAGPPGGCLLCDRHRSVPGLTVTC